MANSGLQFLMLTTSCVILLITGVTSLPLSDFYEFGIDAEDTVLPRNDDDSQVFVLPSAFNFFGTYSRNISVNNNGNLSPGMALSQFDPTSRPFGSLSIIAVYWGDVDTEPDGGGNVLFRLTSAPTLLQRALTDIQRAYSSVTSIDYIFIATWDHVGYYDNMIDRTNTFQCVIAVTGDQTYAIYLYADGLIQWTLSRSLAGYSAGDGIISYTIPGSLTEDLLNIASTSNVQIPGMWVFRLDEDDVRILCNNNEEFALLDLSPRYGSQLGGTLVTVRGPCFERSDSVLCSFGGVATPGIYINQDSVVCVSPAMNAIGRVEVTVTVRDRPDGEITFQKSASFHSIPILKAHGVDVMPSLVVDSRTNIEVSWDPATILPLAEDPTSFNVDIFMYSYDYTSGIWRRNNKFERLPNSGHAKLGMGTFSNNIRATCIHVTLGRLTQITSNVKELVEALRQSSQNMPFPHRVGLWTGLLFSVRTAKSKKITDRQARNRLFNPACSAWGRRESNEPLGNAVDTLPPCPPTRARAELPNSGLEVVDYKSSLYTTNYHIQWMETFHPDASTCFMQTTVVSGSPGQQCCYDSVGNLVVGSQSGGSVNRYAPVDLDSFHQHIQQDVLPKVFCCPGKCNRYYRFRPSDDGENYKPPPPACIYGDPHIITLDGLQYTFNGKGEFTLIETMDGLFKLQGRMVEVEDSAGSNAPATVFSTIACKQSGSDTVQFTIAADNAVNATVNGEIIDFEELSEQMFTNVVVMDKGNATYATTFSNGAYIEVRSANGFISLLLVSLPGNFINTTSGLMGSFNGDTEDDLAPKVGNGTGNPIPSNSSLEEIHNQFGITWIIDNAEDSIFSYQESLGESWELFYDPNYMPAFSPTFDDPALEEMAIEICGDSQFCLFDIAATKRPEVGMTTAVNNEEYDMVVNMSQPVVCDSPCENGACVATNTCMCAEGYSGDTCSVPEMKECEENVCENGGTCELLAGSFICTCPPHLTGVSCELLLPPEVASDAIEHTPLMSVPLIIDPIELGFIDYRQLISLCYEVRGSPRHTVNLVSTKCTSINARYARLGESSSEITFEAVGIRTVDTVGNCNNIQVNRECSVIHNGEILTSNFAANNISIEVSSDFIRISIPNCGRKIVINVRCFSFDDSPVISFNITRSYIDQDITHGLIGQFWSADISSEVYTGDPAGLIPGYDPYTLTVDYPQVLKSRKFVGVLIPRLWNHDAGQCIYAGNSVGGSTGTGPSAPMDSVIEGEYRHYRVRDLFWVEFAYSKFQSRLCIE